MSDTARVPDWLRQVAKDVGRDLSSDVDRRLTEFGSRVRVIISAAVQRGASDVVIRIATYPSIAMAYRDLQKELGVDDLRPTLRQIYTLIASLLAEARSR